MKVAFIVSEFPSVSETFILNQITGLLDRGHEVQVFAHAPGSAVSHPEVERYDLRARTHYLRAPEAKLERLRAAKPLLLNGWRRQPRVLLRLLNPLTRGLEALSLTLLYQVGPLLQDFDIVHCQFGPNGNFGARLKALGVRGKLVTTFHGYDIRLGLEHGGAIYRDLFERGDAFLAISDYNRQRLLEFGADPDKVVCHPVGIEVSAFARPANRQRHEPQRIRALTVARLVEEKGLQHMLRALALLRQQQPGVQLDYAIVGDGPLRGELQALIAELGLRDCVYLLGAGDREFVRNQLWASDVFILPSVAEVLPISLMEAHAAGLPALATDVGSVRQIVQAGLSGWVAPPGDVAALANGLARLIAQPERWAALGEAGRRHVAERYDIHRLNDRLVEIYRGLLNEEPL